MDWKQILASVDDDYLIGISNKGIVKRAYKDREELPEAFITIPDSGEAEGTVTVGDETVKIRYPLGDSKCSCPSRSICRHVILAILLAREQVGKSTDKLSETPVKQGEEMATGQSAQVMEEIKAYPLKPLLRALGTKALRSLTERMQTQDLPQIQYASVVTVELPVQEMVVKLLSPLEYSACTCHKKELCSHKAEAILWCKWKEQVITTKTLLEASEQAPEYDRGQIREASLQIKSYLEELLCMGLCRTSMEAVNTLERLAIVAHNAELPRLENDLRALADIYGRYLRRSAAFSVTDSMRRVCRLHRGIQRLLTTANNSDIVSLVGEFHAQYKLVGDLDLVGVTWEHFVSQSGYEGDTIYFLEEHTGKWYTYTASRPTFYEGKKRSGYTEKAQAPWGLPVALEGMVNLKIHVQGAKCDDSGRLSASQDTRGEITGNRELTEELLNGWYFDDFGEAFAEQISMNEEDEKEAGGRQQHCQLVFLQPALVEPAKFDEVEQVLRMPLWDAEGRSIVVEVPYSQKEDRTIRYLERLKENPPPCFVGRLYLKESRLQLYPLDLYSKKELPWSTGRQKPFAILRNMTQHVKLEFAKNTPQDAMLEVLQEAELALGDLYQVGFDTVQEAVLQSLREVTEKAENYGMEYMSKLFGELAEHITMERHRVTKQEAETGDSILRQYTLLCEYVSIGRKKAMYDRAKEYYTKREE